MSAVQHQSPSALDKTSWGILNALSDDCEDLERIYRGLCYDCVPAATGNWNEYRAIAGAPLLWEVVEHLRELINRGLILPAMDEHKQTWNPPGDDSVLWKAWFAMTPTGRDEWERSEFFDESAPATA